MMFHKWNEDIQRECECWTIVRSLHVAPSAITNTAKERGESGGMDALASDEPTVVMRVKNYVITVIECEEEFCWA